MDTRPTLHTEDFLTYASAEDEALARKLEADLEHYRQDLRNLEAQKVQARGRKDKAAIQRTIENVYQAIEDAKKQTPRQLINRPAAIRALLEMVSDLDSYNRTLPALMMQVGQREAEIPGDGLNLLANAAATANARRMLVQTFYQGCNYSCTHAGRSVGDITLDDIKFGLKRAEEQLTRLLLQNRFRGGSSSPISNAFDDLMRQAVCNVLDNDISWIDFHVTRVEEMLEKMQPVEG